MVTQLANGLDEKKLEKRAIPFLNCKAKLKRQKILKIRTKFPKFPVLLIEIIPQDYFVVRRMFCQLETQTLIWSLPFNNQRTVSQKFWLQADFLPF